MNIFHKVALQGMKKSCTRTIVTVIGVALAAAMVTAVVTFGISLLDYMTRGAIEKYGDWHIAFLGVTPEFAKEQIENEEVAKTVEIESIGYAKLPESKNPKKPYVYLEGYSEAAFATLPINVYAGRMPQNGEEVMISGRILSEAGARIAVGDTITLEVGNRMNGEETLGQNEQYDVDHETFAITGSRTYQVVGICGRPYYEGDKAPGYTIITKCDNFSEQEVAINQFVSLKNPRHLRQYIDQCAGDYSYLLNDYVLRFMGLSNEDLFHNLICAIGGIVVGIIMIGSIFLIYNSFHISMNERTQQIGILMSVGATTKQICQSVLFEGICIGAIGIPIGILVGIGCTSFLILLVAKNFGNVLYTNVPLTLTVSVPAMLVAVLVSMITILISAYIPAYKAANTPIMDCIRQTGEIKVEQKTIKISNVTQRLFGLEGMLALKNFKRNKKRYRSIIMSLVLSVVLFVSASAFVMDMKMFAGNATECTTYDITFASQDMDEKDMLHLWKQFQQVDGVQESAYQENYTCTGEVDSSALSESYWEAMNISQANGRVQLPITMQILDDESFLQIIESLGLSSEEYTGENAKVLAVGKVQKDSECLDLFQGKTVDILFSKTDLLDSTGGLQNSNTQISELATNNGKKINITVADFVPPDTLPQMKKIDSSSVFLHFFIPYSLKNQFVTKDETIDMRGLSFQSDSPTKSTIEMQNMIDEAGITATYQLYNMNKMMEENRNNIFIVNVFSYSFILMISLIAIANVFNTISTNIKLRRRELAMLRSVGMSERDFQKMMNYECCFFGIRALAYGLPLSIIAAWLVYLGMFSGEVSDIHFIMPWGSLAISIIGVMVIIFITMLYAISKIKKENIIDALRDDIV